MKVRCEVETHDAITFADEFDDGMGLRAPELEVTMAGGSGTIKYDVYLSPYSVQQTIDHLTAVLTELKARENGNP